MIFIHDSQPGEVSIIFSAQVSSPSVTLLSALMPEIQKNDLNEIRNYVYNALGYNPTYALEPRIVVIVEGKTDVQILKSFAEILEKFMPLRDVRQAKKYTPVVIFAAAGKKCLIVLDNDQQDPKGIKNEIMRQETGFCKNVDSVPVLTDDNFKPYPPYYLFEAEAICKAADRMDRLDKVKNDVNLKMSSKISKPKEVLEEIWNNNEFGPYCDGGTAVKISKFISKS
jgi:hypothetical protein